MPAKVSLLGLPIDNFSFDEAVDAIEGLAKGQQPTCVFTPNIDHLRLYQEDPDFRAAYAAASLVLADGMPLLWASKWHRRPLKEKVSGSDLFPSICARAAEQGLSVFLLGAEKGVAQQAANVLKNAYPSLVIAGIMSPVVGFDLNTEQNLEVLDCINNASPKILFVALGSPKQEKWISAHLSKLNAGVVLGVGASFDFIAGHKRRAPNWSQRLGLEWLFRLTREPKRLWRRYILLGIPTAIKLFTNVDHPPENRAR